MEFEVESGEVVVSDPCYGLGELTLEVKSGTWESEVEMREGRVGALRASTEVPFYSQYNEHVANIPVDSGQAGIFEIGAYRNDNLVEAEPKFWKEYQKSCKSTPGEYWYAACCDAKLYGDNPYGEVPGGVVASSGYGDGVYSVEVVREDDEIVAIKITFIEEE